MPITCGLHLAGDGDQRNAVELGVGDGRDQVRRAGAAGGHADARLAGGAGVALRREAAALLVPRQNRADLVVEARQRLVQRHAGPARIGEDHVDAVVDQRLHEDVGAAGEVVLRFGLGCGRHGNKPRAKVNKAMSRDAAGSDTRATGGFAGNIAVNLSMVGHWESSTQAMADEPGDGRRFRVPKRPAENGRPASVAFGARPEIVPGRPQAAQPLGLIRHSAAES